MGSTFGKVRKYSLNPVDDSATPLKYSSVTEEQTEPPSVPPQSKPPLPREPSPLQQPFVETTPNYSQLIPEHLRVNRSGMPIPRTSSNIRRDWLKSPSSNISVKGPPVTSQDTTYDVYGKRGGFDFSTENNFQPEQNHYSGSGMEKFIAKLRSRELSQSTKPERTTQQHHTTMEPLSHQPCKYCGGFDSFKHRAQYVVDSEPPPYRGIPGETTPIRSEGRADLGYIPPKRHYHIIEVHPQPYFSSNDPGPLHSYGRYNVFEETARPNVMGPVPSYEAKSTQTMHENAMDMNDGVKGSQQKHKHSDQKQNSSIPHQNQFPSGGLSNQGIKNRDTLYKNDILSQPLVQNVFRSHSLPRGISGKCYTIPEEKVVLPPPFHHSPSFPQVNRWGDRM